MSKNLHKKKKFIKIGPETAEILYGAVQDQLRGASETPWGVSRALGVGPKCLKMLPIDFSC